MQVGFMLCVASVLGFGLIVSEALKSGEFRRRRSRIRRDEHPVYFYAVLAMHAGACLLAISIFSGLFTKIIQWSI